MTQKTTPLRHFLHRYLLYVFAFVFVGLSLVPSMYELTQESKIQSNRYFELVHNFPTDYNFYLSRIRQGISGNTSIHEVYTSESHAGSYIHGFYLFLGLVGNWTRTPWHLSGAVYHTARIIFGITLLCMVAFMTKRLFASFFVQCMAFLLAVTAASWANFIIHAGEWRYAGYMGWWTVMDTLQRITHIPHLLAGQSLIVFFVFALMDERVTRRLGNAVFLGLLGFLLGMIFPPGLLFVIAYLIVALVIDLLFHIPLTKQEKYEWFRHRVLLVVIFMALSGPALLYLQLMVSFYPWKQLVLQDVLRPLPFHYKEYFLAVGPLLPLGLLGFILAIIKKQKRMLVPITWVTTWALLLFLFQFIPSQSPLRFSQMLVHVPLGFLTAYLVVELFWAGKRYKQKSSKAGIGVVMIFLSFVIPLFSILYGLGNMYSSWRWQKEGIDTKVAAAYPLVPTGAYIMYPLKGIIDAIQFIQNSSSRDAIVLSDMTFGNYMPVYGGNRVFLGHPNNTVFVEQKQEQVKRFYSVQMTKEDADIWMKQNAIRFVVYGPQETEYGGPRDLSSLYTSLRISYQGDYYTVYETPFGRR